MPPGIRRPDCRSLVRAAGRNTAREEAIRAEQPQRIPVDFECNASEGGFTRAGELFQNSACEKQFELDDTARVKYLMTADNVIGLERYLDSCCFFPCCDEELMCPFCVCCWSCLSSAPPCLRGGVRANGELDNPCTCCLGETEEIYRERNKLPTFKVGLTAAGLEVEATLAEQYKGRGVTHTTTEVPFSKMIGLGVGTYDAGCPGMHASVDYVEVSYKVKPEDKDFYAIEIYGLGDRTAAFLEECKGKLASKPQEVAPRQVEMPTDDKLDQNRI